MHQCENELTGMTVTKEGSAKGLYEGKSGISDSID